MLDVKYTPEGVHFGLSGFVTWDDIETQRNTIRFADSVLVKLSFTYGRVSFIHETAIYDRAEWARIKENLTGQCAWYSDFAGKHSETSIMFWDNIDVEETTDLPDILAFHRVHGMYDGNLSIIEEAIVQGQEAGELDDNGDKIPGD